MNYQKHYDALMDRAKNRLLEGYCERHHIIPRCMNGTDDSENLVALTAEEHYVAHQLLVKIYPEQSKLIYAVKMMTANNRFNSNRNNKEYAWIRKKCAEVNPMHNLEVRAKLKKPKSLETKTKMSTAKKNFYANNPKELAKMANRVKEWHKNNPNKNPMKSAKAKLKISTLKKDTVLITDGLVRKFIHKNDPLPQGFILVRKRKK